MGGPAGSRSLAFRLPLLSRILANPRHGYDGWLHTQIADAKLALGDTELVGTVLGAAESALTDVARPRAAGTREPRELRRPERLVDQRNGLEGLWFTPLATANGQRNGSRERINAVAARIPRSSSCGRTRSRRASSSATSDGHRRRVRRAPHAYRADPRADIAAPLPAPEQVLVRARGDRLRRRVQHPAAAQALRASARARELERFGIDVRVDLPGVGENLQDRYEVGVVSEMPTDFGCSRGARSSRRSRARARPVLRRLAATARASTRRTAWSVVDRAEVDARSCPLPTSSSSGCRRTSAATTPATPKELERHKRPLHLGDPEGPHAQHRPATCGCARPIRATRPRSTSATSTRAATTAGEDLDAVVDRRRVRARR